MQQPRLTSKALRLVKKSQSQKVICCMIPFIIIIFKDLFIYFWLCRVLVAARAIFIEPCGIFCCSVQALHCSSRASL